MTALASYSTGTVSVAAGGTTVTGAECAWLGTQNVKPGDVLQIGNYQSVIADVVDLDELEIPPWGGGAQSGVAYTIWQVSPRRFAGAEAMATVSQLVAAFETSGFMVFVKPVATEPDPSLGNDGQYADQPTTGKKWVKIGGVWTYLGIYKAFQLKGAWDGGTDYTVGDVVALGGSSYVCVLDHANHTPPNATYWQLLAARGTDGDDGAAATVAVGTVTTGAGGSAAAVNNSGTSSAAVLDFTIPAGKSYGGTSTTSRTIGAGSQAFTTQAGLAYQDGARVRASSAANTSNWMEGLATYAATTLTISVDRSNGSGAHADWIFNVVGEPGAGDLSSANNLSDLASAATARGNLGLTESIVTATIGHLPGIASNAAASAGEVGEVVSASGTSGSLSSGVTANLGSIPLPEGDFDISAMVTFNTGGGTNSTDYYVALSETSASLTPYGTSIQMHERTPSTADHSQSFTVAPTQALTNATKSFYLNARAVFTGTAVTATWSLRARRMR